MKAINGITIAICWVPTLIDLVVWRLSFALPLAESSGPVAERLDRYQLLTMYASLVLLIVALMATRRASAKVRWLAIAGPALNLLIFGLSILFLVMALSGAHIT